MDLMSLTVSPRTGTGKGVARQLRRDGLAPAVCYGLKKDPLHLAVDPHALQKVFKGPLGRNVVFHLDVEKEKAPRKVVVQDLQVHPVRRTIDHVDFLEVTDESTLVVDVPVVVEGKSKGVKAGGRLRQVLKRLPVQCKPADVPAALPVDVTELEIGDVLYVEDMPLPEGVEPGMKSRVPVITIRSGRELEAQALALEGGAEGEEGAAEGEEAAAEGGEAAAGEGE